jgi:hypothetical protein
MKKKISLKKNKKQANLDKPPKSWLIFQTHNPWKSHTWAQTKSSIPNQFKVERWN